MRSPRSVVPAVLLVVAGIVVPLAGVALANGLRPVIVERPAASLDPAADISEMPDPPATVRPLATWFERLPIVDPGSDATPRPFLSRYRDVPVGDLAGAAGLIDAAVEEIRVAPSDRAVTRDFLDALTLPSDGAGEEEPDPDDIDDESEVPEMGPFDTPAFRSLSEQAMKGIAATPSNALAVNDLAVAIATVAFAEPSLLPSETDAGRPIASSSQLREAATHLLEVGQASFPTDRAMRINLAHLRSLEGGSDDLGEPVFSDRLPAAIEALQEYADRAPTDATARALLANVVVRADLGHGLDRAVAIAQPVIDDPVTEAAGRVIRADALLFVADRDRTRSPFLARSTARRALDDYDIAIELSGDAAAFAGRARALDLLRSREAALEAQREAVGLNPSSVAWRLRLAQLEACTGQTDGWRRDAQAAFGAASTAKAPPAVATRYVLADPPARDYGKYSIGSDLPTWDVTLRVPATGTTIVALDPFPEPETCLPGEPAVTTALDDAALEVALAAIAEDDLSGARAALDAWRDQLPEVDGETLSDAIEPTAAATVLDLLAGGQLAEEDDSIRMFLPLASRLPPDAQSRMCRMLSGVVGLAATDADALVVCTAEAAERTGDHEAAARAIEPAIRLDDRTNPVLGSAALQAGMLSELTGHLDIARARYAAASSYAETSIAGLVRLGDLDLRENDASGALDHYALAEAAIRTQSAAADGVDMNDALAERLGQYLDNNRGIALLMTARTETDVPPDCAAYAAECRKAADAFAAAMAADPMNPVYSMNAAWVARLTGDADRATTLLEESLANGIPLRAAANNDLGVLAARRGDLVAARSHFHQAIELEAGYDLATWNLGVLESRSTGALLLGGQALMTDATQANRAFRAKDLSFQTDERVYRVEVSGDRLELVRAPGTGAAAGAAAFGVIATLGAMVRFISGLGGLEDMAVTLTQEGLTRGRRPTLRRRGLPGLGSVGARLPSRPWFAWIPALVVLFVATAWAASWMAPDAFVTTLAIGLVAALLALVVHACGHLVVAGRLEASMRPAGWAPGIVLALIGMPFHVPAGPFLAERIAAPAAGASWWASFAGVLANLGAAAFAILLYIAVPMPFLRVLIATQLAVAAFALIPSEPLDGDRLATRPVVLALTSLGIAAASTAIAVGAI